MTPSPQCLKDASSDADWAVAASTAWRHSFTCDWSSFVDSADLAQLQAKDVKVLQGLVHLEGGRVGSDFQPLDLEAFLARYEPDSGLRKQAETSGDAAASHKDALTREFPWAAQGLAKLHREAKPKKVKAELPLIAGSSEENEEAEDEDDVVQAAFAELRRRNNDLDLEHLSTWDDFKVQLESLGGVRKSGVPYDAFRGYSRTELAAQFCRENRSPLSATFAFSVYTEHKAGVLARSWCHRLQYFFDKSLHHPDLLCTCTPAERSSYQEPSELTALAEEPDLPANIQRRIATIRAVFA